MQIFGCVLIAVGSYATTNSVSRRLSSSPSTPPLPSSPSLIPPSLSLCALPVCRLEIGALSGQTLPIGIAVLGVFILLLSLLGGLAAWKESRAFLLVYFVFLLLLTLILFFVGIAVYVERNSASTYITQGWNTASPDLRHSLQTIFACCGCCDAQYVQINSTQADACVITDPTLQQGCLSVFTSYFQQYYVTAGGCGIGFAVVMFVGMLVVCFLMQGIKKKRAEQDLAKLRANHNADDADLQLTMQGEGVGTGGTGGGGTRRRQGEEEEEEEEEEGEDEEEEEEDEEQ